jgi:tRNA nucleotidyltransferase/poly(A) polymerase
VRDAIRMYATDPSASQQQLLSTLQDIDIVTTAPPPVARAICEQLAPELPDGGVWSPRFVEQFGVVLAGGKKAGQKDSEGLDVCAMKRGGSTSEMVVHPDTGERAFPTTFGDDLVLDAHGRDFCCNALYFDPANGVVVDPTLQGIADAEHALLHPVNVPSAAQPGDPSLAARFWKFRLRGFSSDGETQSAMRSNARAAFSTSTGKERWTLQNVLGRTAPKDAASRAQVEDWLVALRSVMNEDRCADLFDRAVRGGVREGVISEVLKRTNKGQPAPGPSTTTGGAA